MHTLNNTSTVPLLARTGLIAKGIIYCLIGVIAFMAAFELNGQTNEDASKKGVFEIISRQTGGKILLGVVVLGLLCYCAWRFYEVFNKKDSGFSKKSNGKRLRYLFSGLVYLSLAVYGAKMLLFNEYDNGDSTQETAANLLNKPFGQWLLGIFGLIIAGVGIYQAWYGLSEKYRKHVGSLGMQSRNAKVILVAGKAGYIARGVVWLIISWLLLKAAMHASSKEAGDTGKAFGFLEDSPFGSYMLGALGVGLIAYGLFSFVRARYERFG